MNRPITKRQGSLVTVTGLQPVFKHTATVVKEEAKACHPDTHCATCQVPLVPEHAHMRCPICHQRDSCCM